MGNLIRAAKVPTRVRTDETQQQRDESAGLYFTSPKENISFIHSGCALLDCTLGGGWPLGRISNIIGDKSTGKTLLAIEACSNFARQFHQGDILYIEAESAFDRDYAGALGLPIKRVRFEEGLDTVEGMFEAIGEFIGADLLKEDKEGRAKETKLRTKPALVIVDSLDALSDKAEASRGINEGSYGATKARKLSEVFRRSVRALGKTQTHVQIISQIRDNIGATFGRKWTRSGGHALDFYASQILVLAHLGSLSRVISGQKRAYGVTIKAKTDKCKVGFPFRECQFNIRFGYGIEDLEACLEWLASIKKESRVPGLLALKRMRGNELKDARALLAKVVSEEWYAIEKQFAPTRGKYAE